MSQHVHRHEDEPQDEAGLVELEQTSAPGSRAKEEEDHPPAPHHLQLAVADSALAGRRRRHGEPPADEQLALARRSVNLLELAGWEVIGIEHLQLFPFELPLVSGLANRLLVQLPLIRHSCYAGDSVISSFSLTTFLLKVWDVV